MLTIALMLYSGICIFVWGCYENHKDWKMFENASNLLKSLGLLSFGFALLSPSVPWVTTLSGCGFLSGLGAIVTGVLACVLGLGATLYWADKDPAWDLPEDK